MSERIKGVFGCAGREHEIKDWLLQQDPNICIPDLSILSNANKIFFTVKGCLGSACADSTIEALLDIVPLPRWRAFTGETYYYISSEMRVSTASEGRWSIDDLRYYSGNYFSTRAEAEEYQEKFNNLLKERL